MTPTTVESLWLFLQSAKILLLCIYIPPSVKAADLKAIETYIVNSCDYFSTTLHEHNVVIGGDFNTFNTNLLCTDLNLKNIVNSPTCGDSFLDKIQLSDSLSKLSSSAVGPPLANSDHCSVSATFQCCAVPPTKVLKTVYDLRPQHVRTFVDSVSSIDFQSIITSSDTVHMKCSLLQSSITDCFDNHIPCPRSQFHIAKNCG